MIWWMLIFMLYLRVDVTSGVFLTLLVLKEKAWPEPSCMGERLPGKLPTSLNQNVICSFWGS
jgi:hypothetical protein